MEESPPDGLDSFSSSVSLSGDEIYSVNGVPVAGLTHSDAISMFKEVKQGEIVIVVGRRKKIGASPDAAGKENGENVKSNAARE